jgi:hypothetical protein
VIIIASRLNKHAMEKDHIHLIAATMTYLYAEPAAKQARRKKPIEGEFFL